MREGAVVGVDGPPGVVLVVVVPPAAARGVPLAASPAPGILDPTA